MDIPTESFLLALDVSTFCIGFCIWNLSKNKLETAGHIPLKKYKDWLDKVNHVCDILTEINENTQTITHVAIEDIITKFASGRSNIKTIIKLAGFNYVIQRKCYEIFDTTPSLHNVIRSRNLADCKVPKGSNAKEFILKRVCELHPEVKEMLPMKKTKPEFAVEAFDLADAVVVSRAAAVEIENGFKK